MRRDHSIVVLFIIIITSAVLAAQAPKAPKVAATGHINKPEQRQFADALLSQLRVPAGFHVSVFARDLGQPRMIAVADDGGVYVTRQHTNDVILLRPKADGSAEPMRKLAANVEQVHGIAIRGRRIFLASPTTIWAADLQTDGGIGPRRELTKDLPDGGQHRGRNIAIGPDNLLYVSIGSSCNDCAEAGKDRATIQRLGLDGSGRQVVARGLRDTIGFGWHPETRELWGIDNGADWKGDMIPPEELNQIKEGANYGWPLCYGRRTPDHATTADPKQVADQDISKEQYCATTEPSVLEFPAHSAPIGMVFYTGQQFPADYRGDALAVFRGSWNRDVPSGYRVMRIHFEGGKPVKTEDFLTGFLLDGGNAQFARLAGIAVAKDGSLLVSDDTGGVIYRVAYTGR